VRTTEQADRLAPLSEAVAAGRGLPDVVRAAARALDATLLVTDDAGEAIAVAANSPADERAILSGGTPVHAHLLKRDERVVGLLCLRTPSRADAPVPGAVQVVRTLIAAELERHGASDWAMVAEEGDVARALLHGESPANALDVDFVGGGAVVVVRAWDVTGAPVGWESRLGYSRRTARRSDLHRAGLEATLAADLAPAAGARGFADTGAYRLLLPFTRSAGAELRRFYEETVAPLVDHDQARGTELVDTLQVFLECDGNHARAAQRLFTHRHTVRYRLGQVRELTGLDVRSTDGREQLGLGLKAMRVLAVWSAPSN
jgi:PucR C-terminal helix-turn-helix domain